MNAVAGFLGQLVGILAFAALLVLLAICVGLMAGLMVWAFEIGWGWAP